MNWAGAPVQPGVSTSAAEHVAASNEGGAVVTDLSTLERRHIETTLASVGGDKSRAAQLLGISRRTLERRVAEWAAQLRA